jgi:signal transduction histidine kinase
LDYGRISNLELSLCNVDLEAQLEGILILLGEELGAKDAEVSLRRPLPQIWANTTVLSQVLTNLLTNALKFVRSGIKPKIQIWAEETSSDVRLYVRDNGIGIELSYHQKIFQVFERLHRAESYPGTGIGLAIVLKGVERMGGRVGLESEPGKGSAFWISLPKAKAALSWEMAR